MLVCFCGVSFGEISADSVRLAAVKFMNDNGMGGKLTEPVSVVQEPSGVLRITGQLPFHEGAAAGRVLPPCLDWCGRGQRYDVGGQAQRYCDQSGRWSR